MEFLIEYLQQGLSYIIPLIILLGLLIFVHEMGHFLVAKYNGVRVEVFSLGFGKKIFSFKKGETEYSLSLIPFGGYVKMYGDDPTADIPDDLKARSFLHKPVGQRIAIVLAGPLMNFFFAIVLFFAIAMIGENKPKPILGDIGKDTMAYTAGFRSGDEITNINGQVMTTWNELHAKISESANKDLKFELLRNNNPISFTAAPKKVENDNVLSTKETIGKIEGLQPTAVASRVGVRSPETLAAQNGFQSGDWITSVNSKPVKRWHELIETINDNKETQVTFVVERYPLGTDKKESQDSNNVTIKLPIKSSENAEKFLARVGLESLGLYIDKVKEDSPADKAGLKTSDRIVSLNGKQLSKWEELVKEVRSYTEGQPPIALGVLRNGQNIDLKMTPEKIDQKTPVGGKVEVFALGVYPGLTSAPINTVFLRTLNPITALKKGVVDTWKWTVTTCVSFLRLIQNRVSARAIAGPITIGQIAGDTFKVGISPFLKIMAIISINLFILNLLPVPVLDGGHLVFFTLEAIRGAPLSMKKMEIAQQIGLVILLCLMALAIFNDVTRLFE